MRGSHRMRFARVYAAIPLLPCCADELETQVTSAIAEAQTGVSFRNRSDETIWKSTDCDAADRDTASPAPWLAALRRRQLERLTL
jgi:hypothetical protein